MAVFIHRQCSQPRIPVKNLKQWLERCCQHLHLGDAELSVLLTDDPTIHKLNRIYRGKDKPTDILSFSMREHRHAQDPLPPHPQILGDLVLSLPTVQRQARIYGTSLRQELERVLVHGLLHLMGHNHIRVVDRLRMEREQVALLSSVRKKGG